MDKYSSDQPNTEPIARKRRGRFGRNLTINQPEHSDEVKSLVPTSPSKFETKRRIRNRKKIRRSIDTTQMSSLKDSDESDDEDEKEKKGEGILNEEDEGEKEKKEDEKEGEEEDDDKSKKKDNKFGGQIIERKILNNTLFDVGDTLYLTTKNEVRPEYNGVLKTFTEKVNKIGNLTIKYTNKNKHDVRKELEKMKNYQEKRVQKMEKIIKEKLLKVNFEEEGIYEGSKPTVLNYNGYILEQRCLRSKNGFDHYFDETGNFLFESDPCTSISTRPNDLFQEYEEPISLKKTIPWISKNLGEEEQEFYQLDCEVNKIVFEDHPLMNEEEFYSHQLKKLFWKMNKLKKNNLTTYYKNRIIALKKSLEKFKTQFEKVDKNTKVLNITELATDDIAMTIGYKMNTIRNQIKKTRADLETENRSEIELVNGIIRTWNKIKEIRIKNKIKTTSVKVEFEKIKTNRIKEEEEIENQINDEINEIESDIFWEYKQDLHEYNNIVAKELDKKPIKPKLRKFNKKKLKEKIKRRIFQNRKKPGSSIIIPKLTRTNLTKEDDLPLVEKNRQKEIQKCLYFVKLLINDKEVSQTGPSQLLSDFSLYIGEIVPVSVLKWPNSICLQIRQINQIGPLKTSSHISSVYISAPGLEVSERKDPTNQDLENPQRKKVFEKLMFNGITPYFPKYESSKGPNEMKREHFINGTLKVKINWTSLIYGEQAKAPPVPKAQKEKRLFDNYLPTSKDLIDMQNLKKWLKGRMVDPNDPKNTGLLSMFELIENKKLTRKGFFLTEQNESLFIKESFSHQQKMARLKEPENTKKRMEFVEKYVIEPQIPKNIFGFFSWIWDIFARRRPLNPDRKTRVREHKTPKRKCCIFVQIIRAHNIPSRTFSSFDNFRKHGYNKFENERRKQDLERRYNDDYETDELKDGIERELDDYTSKVNNVKPFIEVYFSGRSRRTCIAEGQHPQFNETLELPFVMKNNDYSPDALRGYNETIYFDFFDQKKVLTMKDERHVNIEKRRIEERYLGTFSLPFSTLYQNGQIYGKFKVKIPCINLGYEYKGEMYFTVNVTLDPPIPLSLDILDIQQSGETPELTTYCQWWTKSKKKFNRTMNRNIIALCPNLYGKGTLICRYICPQKPPDDLSSETELLRYVSMIPFFEDILNFEERTEVWTSSQQLLDMGGDYEEHAILLCNYFLYSGKEAYVLIGSAVPEGKTAYVLTLGDGKDGESRLWNASTGDVYSVHDTTCPIISVGCIFNQTNIWANIQKEECPSKISFDIQKKFCWEPLFKDGNRGIYNSNISVQSEISYKTKDETKALKFEKDIMRELKVEISKNRVTYPSFKYHIENDLRQILEDLEHEKLNNSTNFQNIIEKQEKMLGADIMKNIIGFPLNFKKIEVKKIIREVLNTKIHEIGEGESNVSFGTGVYVHPYNHNIYSIWIYIVAIFEGVN